MYNVYGVIHIGMEEASPKADHSDIPAYGSQANTNPKQTPKETCNNNKNYCKGY